MNTAAQEYPPREIKQPTDLKQVEICSRSGLLATDKCYDAVKAATGDAVQRRAAYLEIATPAQAPTEPCNVHGEPRARLVRNLPSGDLPRAALAVDLSEVTPVPIKNPTLLADNDPYSSLKPTLKPEPTPEPARQTADNQEIESEAVASQAASLKPAGVGQPAGTPIKPAPESAPPIRKAIPVEPQDKKPVEIRRAVPVKPLDQENEDQTLLKSAPPASSDLNQ